MLIKLRNRTPFNCTLAGGTSFYIYPGQTSYIGEQDYYMTKSIQGAVKKKFFLIIEEEDSEKQKEYAPKKKALSKQDMALEESKPRFHEQPETIAATDKFGQVIDTRPLTKEDKIRKVSKRKIKIKKKNSKGKDIK